MKNPPSYLDFLQPGKLYETEAHFILREFGYGIDEGTHGVIFYFKPQGCQSDHDRHKYYLEQNLRAVAATFGTTINIMTNMQNTVQIYNGIQQLTFIRNA